MPMNRREMLKTATLAATLPVLPVLPALPALPHPHFHSAQGKKPPTPALRFLSVEQNLVVVKLTELIIPQTDTPGARAAGVSFYVDQVLAASSEAERRSFLEGIAWLDVRARQAHGAPFMKLSEAQQVAVLEPLSTGNNLHPEDQPGVRFFERLKELTITGYYTSADGFVAELGFTNGFTGDFPGCTHPEHK